MCVVTTVLIRFLEIESHNESMGQWVMGLGYDGSDGSWVTNGDPWSTLIIGT